jgi:predicted DNA-binding protein
VKRSIYAVEEPALSEAEGTPYPLIVFRGIGFYLSDTYATMSDMASGRLTIRIPETLGQRLRRRSQMKGQPESALVREALETYLGQSVEPRPAYQLAEEAGLIGLIGRGRKAPPKDLSTARRHFEGFGKSK